MEKAELARAQMCGRLWARRVEIEQAIAEQIADRSSVQEVHDRPGPRLVEVVSSGVNYGLATVEEGATAGPIPQALLLQARQAARDGVGLATLLHDYLASYALFTDFIMKAAEEVVPVRGEELRRILRVQATLLEQALLAVFREHDRERCEHHRTRESHQLVCVRRLLAGGSVTSGELAYEIEDWHVAAVARGDGAAQALRQIAAAADRRLLLVHPDGETTWAWLGGRRRPTVAELTRWVRPGDAEVASIAFGEAARGLRGWRLTHHQASAAMQVAPARPGGMVRYADVGLLASVAQDPLLSSSLRDMYLAPLSEARDGGVRLRGTLRSYFEAGRNITSAASALGVSRQTVASRLRAVEEMLGRTLESCGPELEVALRLESVDPFEPPPPASSGAGMST